MVGFALGLKVGWKLGFDVGPITFVGPNDGRKVEGFTLGTAVGNFEGAVDDV